MLNSGTQSSVRYLCFSLLLLSYLFFSGCVSEKPKGPEIGLVQYKSSNVIGYEGHRIIVDSGFVPCMDKIDNYASENNVIIYVTHSFRKKDQKLTGAIVSPAVKSNHLVGHAIDMNIFFGGVLYESKDMYTNKWDKLPFNVRNFLDHVRNDPTLRWGGIFSPEDPVHIDDELFGRNSELWQELYEVYQ